MLNAFFLRIKMHRAIALTALPLTGSMRDYGFFKKSEHPIVQSYPHYIVLLKTWRKCNLRNETSGIIPTKVTGEFYGLKEPVKIIRQ